MGTIDDYLATLEREDRDVIAHTYAVATAAVPGAEQGTGYGMPALVYRGRPLLSVMRAKRHIGLYPFSPLAIDAVAAGLAGFDTDKGTVRFQPEHPLPDAVVTALVQARRAQIEG